MISIINSKFLDQTLAIKSKGELNSSEDLSKYFNDTYQIFQQYKPLYLILDETQVVNNLNLVDNFDFADTLSESFLLSEIKKLAIISRSRDLENNRVFANFLMARKIEMEIFLEFEDALSWFN